MVQFTGSPVGPLALTLSSDPWLGRWVVQFTGSPVGPLALTLPRASLSYRYGLNCVPPYPSKFMCGSPVPIAIIFGDGVLGRGVGHETGALKMGSVPLEDEM